MPVPAVPLSFFRTEHPRAAAMVVVDRNHPHGNRREPGDQQEDHSSIPQTLRKYPTGTPSDLPFGRSVLAAVLPPATFAASPGRLGP